jgi:hypothetical protein
MFIFTVCFGISPSSKQECLFFQSCWTNGFLFLKFEQQIYEKFFRTFQGCSVNIQCKCDCKVSLEGRKIWHSEVL